VRDKRRLVEDDVPNIDVIITTCDENVEIVMDTVRAACILHYPNNKYRIFVCDDGASGPLQKAIDLHAVEYPHLHYTARVKGPLKYYKAGNLNHGLTCSGSLHPLSIFRSASDEALAIGKHVVGLPKSLALAESSVSSSTTYLNTEARHLTHVESAPWSEYIAGLDADMIPEPHWLRALLPHIDNDANCALVCPLQVRSYPDAPKVQCISRVTFSRRPAC
jgi:cellulose synthase/poly-beta-1,6-N-acetylglucosamine synthase-like glycosyltransferase